MSLPTVSGVAATRFSPSTRSRTMAIFMKISCSPVRRTGSNGMRGPALKSGLDQKIENDHRDDRDDGSPFDTSDEAFIGALMLGVIHRRLKPRLGMMFGAVFGGHYRPRKSSVQKV